MTVSNNRHLVHEICSEKNPSVSGFYFCMHTQLLPNRRNNMVLVAFLVKPSQPMHGVCDGLVWSACQLKPRRQSVNCG